MFYLNTLENHLTSFNISILICKLGIIVSIFQGGFENLR